MKALYAGSFDPPTNGHVWIIQQAAKLADELVVAVGTNPQKKYLFPLAQRVKILKELTKNDSNVRVTYFTKKFLYQFADENNIDVVIRGLRNEQDYKFEKELLQINRTISTKLQTIFFSAPSELTNISSSLVKNLVGPQNWEKIVAKYVPAIVLISLKQINNEQ